MLCEIKIGYDFFDDKVTITPCEDFNSLPAVQRADVLRDVQHDLEILYKTTVKQITKGNAA